MIRRLIKALTLLKIDYIAQGCLFLISSITEWSGKDNKL